MRTEEKIIENYTDIPALLKNCGARRPFLCCGKSFEKTDAFAYLQAHCRLTVWDTVRPNPRYEDMVAAAELYRKEGCDFIIGAGGGSPLDSAKMIKLLITNPGVVGYDTELRDNDIPFLAIPTTSGTGSEATRYSIFYVNEDEKHSVSHPGFLPGYVLLDPCFLQTVPDYQRKCTCLDALCHATLDGLKGYNGPYCIESFDPRVVKRIRKFAPQVLRGQLVDSYRAYRKEGANLIHAFVISHCFGNFMARPDFIAWCPDKQNWAVRLCARLGAMMVMWTALPEHDQAALEKQYDAVIFQWYHPEVKYK